MTDAAPKCIAVCGNASCDRRLNAPGPYRGPGALMKTEVVPCGIWDFSDDCSDWSPDSEGAALFGDPSELRARSLPRRRWLVDEEYPA